MQRNFLVLLTTPRQYELPEVPPTSNMPSKTLPDDCWRLSKTYESPAASDQRNPHLLHKKKIPNVPPRFHVEARVINTYRYEGFSISWWDHCSTPSRNQLVPSHSTHRTHPRRPRPRSCLSRPSSASCRCSWPESSQTLRLIGTRIHRFSRVHVIHLIVAVIK